MLTLIIQKEIYKNLLNVRFIAACVVSIVLIVSSIVVLRGIHDEEWIDYRSRITTQDNFIDEFGHLNRVGWMTISMREPSHYQPLVLGIDREAQQENFVSNPIPVLFSRLDFVTIITIIMSLVAILFSYNAISGEREAGLLKQMLSASISRSAIVLGKLIGGNLSLLIPFTIGVLAGLIYITMSPSLQIESVDFGVFILLLLISYIYIAAFYSLGLLFSARSHTSNVAVLKSLFAWVILTLVIPNISPFLAAQIYRIPSATKIEREIFATNVEREKLLIDRTHEMLQTRFADLAGVVDLNSMVSGARQNKIQAKVESDPTFKKRYDEFMKAWQELIKQLTAEQEAKANKIQKEFDHQSKYQEKLATIFASVSPLSNFIFIATDITETGIEADNRWLSQTQQYSNMLMPYLMAKYEMERQRNPTFTVNDYVDLRDRPRFQYQPQGFTERIELILPQFGLLVFFNLLFFTVAFVSFLRYDVR